MKTSDKIIQLGEKLPLGAKKLIASNLDMNYKTVDNILKGKTARMSNTIKVVQEAKKVLEQFEQATKI